MANCEELVLFVDTDSVDDLRSVIQTVKRKYSKMEAAKFPSDDDEDSACESKHRKTEHIRRKLKAKSVLPKGKADDISQRDGTKDLTKKLNSPLRRLLSKKYTGTSKNHLVQKETDTSDETGSTDSGIDMTDMIRNFDDSVQKLDSGQLSCNQCGPSVSSTGNKSKRKCDTENTHFPDKKKKLRRTSPCPEELIPVKQLDRSRIVAIDCEFVGVGPNKLSALGRCSIVNYDGEVLCDIYSYPEEPITDYRTPWSGLRRKDMVNAVPFRHAQNHIRRILQDKIVIGHAVHNDFRVLGIYPPRGLIRDTCSCIPLRRLAGMEPVTKCSLKKLTSKLLGREIQRGEHDSVEDCKAALDLYKLVEEQWERDIASPSQVTAGTRRDGDSKHSYLEDEYWPEDI